MCGFLKPFRYTMPGGPSPCPRHYSEAFGYDAASVLPPAHGHCRVLRRRLSGVGVPQCQRQRREQPVAASSTPGGLGTTPANVRTGQARRHALLALGCLSHVSPRPRHDASHRGSLRPHRLQDSNGPPAVAGQQPSFSLQASDPRSCQPLTPAASSAYRCPCMVLCKNHLLRC
jgi:hypothetical protein